MWPVASLPQSFPKTFFGKHQYSFQAGSRSCQVSNGIIGSRATDYAGLGLEVTGGLDIPFPFFTQSAEEPYFSSFFHKECDCSPREFREKSFRNLNSEIVSREKSEQFQIIASEGRV